MEIIKEGIIKNSVFFSSMLICLIIDGLILDVLIKVGNLVIMSNMFNDGMIIVIVVNMNDLIFKGKIDEIEVGCIYEGMLVKLIIGVL